MTNSQVNDAKKRHPEIGILEWFRIDEKEHVEQALKDLQELGVTHLRTGISWADWYTPEGQKWYRWLLPKLAEQVTILPSFLYTPPSMGVSPKTSSPPKDPKSYADFLDVFLTEFGDYFDWIELWNEPNNVSEYDWRLDPEWVRFAEMIGSGANWAKSKFGKKILLGGMSPIDPNWLSLMFKRGLMPYIDAVGVHGFPDVFDFKWEGWETNLKRVQEVLDFHGSDAKIWITEVGYSTWNHNQKRQLREFTKAMQANVDRVYWYSLQDLDHHIATVDGKYLDPREYHFGLKDSNGNPKLLYNIWSSYGLDGIKKFSWIQNSYTGAAPSKDTILITGGAGFVGTNLAHRFMSEGHSVIVLDNLSRPGVEQNLEWLREQHPDLLKAEIGDIRNPEAVERAVSAADFVYHFAARFAVTTSLTNPTEDFEINARGTLNVLEAIARQVNPPPIVFTSTNKVYGGLDDLEFKLNGVKYFPEDKNIAQHGIGEDRMLDFHSPYGCSKGAADQYVLNFARTMGIQGVVFRMSCIYGPHQYGTEDQGWVANFLIRALEGEKINLYGNGKQVRDILFVEDLVDAFILAKENMPKISGNAYNIGGGPDNAISLLEVIKNIEKFTNEPVETSIGEWRPGDQRYYVSDTRKFQEATGWAPKVSSEKGIKRLWDWLKINRKKNLTTTPEPATVK